MGEEVDIYDGHTTKITVSDKYVLAGWWCPRTKLWRIPLQFQVANLNFHTPLLNDTTGQDSINSLYNISSSVAVLEYIDLCNNNSDKPSTVESIHNVYELPSIEQTIRYIHAEAVFPTKYTWIKSICNGNYLTCPLITVTNVHQHFPESEKTQKGHMQNQRQGLQSTKVHSQLPMQQSGEAKLSPEEKKRDVFLAIYKPKETFYTD